MPVVAVFQSPTLTREKYEQVCRKLTGGKRSRMESAADWPVPASSSTSPARRREVSASWTSGRHRPRSSSSAPC